MQETTALYKELLAGEHRVETSLVIGEEGRLINEQLFTITFGGTAILVNRGGGDSGFTETRLKSLSTAHSLFSENTPSVGNCIAGEISITMIKPTADVPRMAQLVPYQRLTDGTQTSEWVQKGVYYVDTREIEDDNKGNVYLTMHGYDAMLKTEQDFPNNSVSFPAPDTDIVQAIADAIGVEVDLRTWDVMTAGYSVPYLGTYTCREVLGYLGAMYAGNFIINDVGQLRLIPINSMPKEARYLIENLGYAIVFGEDRILV